MSDRKFNLHDGKKGSALAVRVTPRASRNEIVELLDDGTIKVRIASPPTDNEANDTLIEFLSQILGVPRSRLDIVAGLTGRDKLISVVDMDADTAHKRILAHLASSATVTSRKVTVFFINSVGYTTSGRCCRSRR